MCGFKGFTFLPNCIYTGPVLLFPHEGIVTTRKVVNNANIINYDKKWMIHPL
jgi:hypothetical protein